MKEFLIDESLSSLDPALAELCDLEAERQARKLIMIPSESTAPLAVRKVLSSAFQNICGGLPALNPLPEREEPLITRGWMFRRWSDLRYYKGVEYADVVESVARRRAAELFAANGLNADDLWVNVQPLSGAPANTAVYTALIKPGDPILGMDLLHGGHLTHGSPVNRSGLVYTAHHYTVDPKTEKLDYDKIMEQAKACMPKVIVAGYTSYAWMPDWKAFRKIADAVGAYLLADISHTAGLVAAGVVPSPIGIADVVSFTTHKTLCGPRGAVLICHDRTLGERIDKGVFPGEQAARRCHHPGWRLHSSWRKPRVQGPAEAIRKCGRPWPVVEENGFVSLVETHSCSSTRAWAGRRAAEWRPVRRSDNAS